MKVLLVDDSKAMRLILRRTLRQAGFGDFDVIEASSAAEGLDLINSEAPDLVLSDWNMPDVSGIEMLERLRADGNQVKVGMVTSRGSQEMRVRASEADALFLITKPFTGDDLKAALDVAIA